MSRGDVCRHDAIHSLTVAVGKTQASRNTEQHQTSLMLLWAIWSVQASFLLIAWTKTIGGKAKGGGVVIQSRALCLVSMWIMTSRPITGGIPHIHNGFKCTSPTKRTFLNRLQNRKLLVSSEHARGFRLWTFWAVCMQMEWREALFVMRDGIGLIPDLHDIMYGSDFTRAVWQEAARRTDGCSRSEDAHMVIRDRKQSPALPWENNCF